MAEREYRKEYVLSKGRRVTAILGEIRVYAGGLSGSLPAGMKIGWVKPNNWQNKPWLARCSLWPENRNCTNSYETFDAALEALAESAEEYHRETLSEERRAHREFKKQLRPEKTDE